VSESVTEPVALYRKKGFPTLGGKQFWTDFRWWFGLRLQQNQVTKHWRVLSPKNGRLASGDLDTCLSAYHHHQVDIPAENVERVVVLVHGLMRTSVSLKRLGSFLLSQGWTHVIDFRYASSRSTMARHAEALHSVISHLPGHPQLNFVGHSMGNIVIRHLIGDWQREGHCQSFLQRLGRIVMLAPPNQGSAVARALGYTGLFQLITGRPGTQLGWKWDEIKGRLSIPPCPVAIVAGESSFSSWNPMVRGPSDLIVAVAETNLPGVSERFIVPAIHSFIMEDRRVQQATARFLNGGSLVTRES
jgi:pimeloyl-ACP methyl ester carboxylesterase